MLRIDRYRRYSGQLLTRHVELKDEAIPFPVLLQSYMIVLSDQAGILQDPIMTLEI